MNIQRAFLLSLFLLMPSATAAQSNAPTADAKPADAKPATEQTEEEKQRQKRYRTAIHTLGISNNKTKVLGSISVLRKGWPASRDVLIASLHARSSRERMFAVKLVGQHGRAEDDLESVAKCLYDTVPTVRLAAVMALQKFGKDSCPYLEKYLPKEPLKNHRKMAVKSLQRLGDSATVPALVGQLDVERDRGVRRFLVKALQVLTKQRIGDDAAAWQEYLSSRNDAVQSRRAAEYSRDLSKTASQQAKSDGSK